MKKTTAVVVAVTADGSEAGFLVASDVCEEAGDMVKAEELRRTAGIRAMGASPFMARFLASRGVKAA